MTLPVKELLNVGEKRLENAGVPDAKYDSRELYCHIFDLSHSQLIMEWQKTVEFDYCDKYFNLLDRRADGEPLQYITGVQEFMGHKIKVTPAVLIPRQDTECVVEKAIEIAKENGCKEILDLCTGSGAIGISMAKELNHAKVVCSDVSEEAVKVAKENIESHGLGKTVEVKAGDLLEPFKGRFSKKKFDMIISNPPYIPTKEIENLMTEVKDHEPMSALDGGDDGLDFYKKIIEDAKNHLKKKGVIVFEIGHNQRESVAQLLRESGFRNVEVFDDLGGNPRTAIGFL